MNAIHFRRLHVLIGLAAVPVLAALWWRAARRADRASMGLGSPGALGSNTTSGVLRLAALAMLIVGAAGPVGYGPAGVPRTAALVVFVLDLSASMSATDARPDRLGQAREAIRHMCDLLPGSRTALVTAARDAALNCPPTAERGTFLSLLERTQTNWVSGAGTELASALELAAEAIERDGAPAVVILASDGEDHGPDPRPLIRRLRDGGSLLHTLTVGTAEGAQLQGTLLDEPVVTRARPDRMAEWASLGGGAAWRAPPDAPGRIVPAKIVRTAAYRSGTARDLSSLFCLAGALLLAGDFACRAIRK